MQICIFDTKQHNNISNIFTSVDCYVTTVAPLYYSPPSNRKLVGWLLCSAFLCSDHDFYQDYCLLIPISISLPAILADCCLFSVILHPAHLGPHPDSLGPLIPSRGDTLGRTIHLWDTTASIVSGEGIFDGVGGVWMCLGSYLAAYGHGQGGGGRDLPGKNSKKKRVSSSTKNLSLHQ